MRGAVRSMLITFHTRPTLHGWRTKIVRRIRSRIHLVQQIHGLMDFSSFVSISSPPSSRSRACTGWCRGPPCTSSPAPPLDSRRPPSRSGGTRSENELQCPRSHATSRSACIGSTRQSTTPLRRETRTKLAHSQLADIRAQSFRHPAAVRRQESIGSSNHPDKEQGKKKRAAAAEKRTNRLAATRKAVIKCQPASRPGIGFKADGLRVRGTSPTTRYQIGQSPVSAPPLDAPAPTGCGWPPIAFICSSKNSRWLSGQGGKSLAIAELIA